MKDAELISLAKKAAEKAPKETTRKAAEKAPKETTKKKKA